jgi:hypothetical protein
LKNDVQYHQKVISSKTVLNKFVFVGVLKVHKNFFGSDFDQATIGGDTIIPRSLRLSRIEFSLV